jgi:hypothetical protein
MPIPLGLQQHTSQRLKRTLSAPGKTVGEQLPTSILLVPFGAGGRLKDLCRTFDYT